MKLKNMMIKTTLARLLAIAIVLPCPCMSQPPSFATGQNSDYNTGVSDQTHEVIWNLQKVDAIRTLDNLERKLKIKDSKKQTPKNSWENYFHDAILKLRQQLKSISNSIPALSNRFKKARVGYFTKYPDLISLNNHPDIRGLLGHDPKTMTGSSALEKANRERLVINVALNMPVTDADLKKDYALRELRESYASLMEALDVVDHIGDLSSRGVEFSQAKRIGLEPGLASRAEFLGFKSDAKSLEQIASSASDVARPFHNLEYNQFHRNANGVFIRQFTDHDANQSEYFVELIAKQFTATTRPLFLMLMRPLRSGEQHAQDDPLVGNVVYEFYPLIQNSNGVVELGPVRHNLFQPTKSSN